MRGRRFSSIKFALFIAALASSAALGRSRCAELLAAPQHALLADPYHFLEVLPRGAAKAPQTIEDYWKGVGLPFTALRAYVTNEACYESEVAFLQCVAAINGLLGFVEKHELRLLPASRAAIAPHVGASHHSFGAADVVELKAPATHDPLEVSRLAKTLRQEVERAWRAEFASGRRIDFEAMLAWARASVVTAETESHVTAAAINAWLAVADAHARITPLKLLEHEQTSDVSEGLVGIGVVVSGHPKGASDEVVVQSLIEGGPAEHAGIRPGDVLTHLDGKSLEGMKFVEAARGIRGAEGSTLVVRVRRGEASHEFTITRRAVTIKNVSSRLLEGPQGKLGFIRLASFMSRSAPDQIAEAIGSLTASGAQGLVLDLRNNGGGELGVAVRIASLFLGAGRSVVTSRSLYPQTIPSRNYRTSEPAATSLPLVVLVNAHSASASELLAGALQDYGRALIVGDRTFGKGTVQAPLEPTGPHEALRGYPIVLFETIARFHLPSGRTNQLTGITPDFLVHHSPSPKPQELFAEREEDIYPNALSALGRPYVQPRPEVIARFRACIERTGVARKIYESRELGSFPLDYQLLFGADVVRCWAEPEK